MIVAPIGMSLKLDFNRPAFMVDLLERVAKEHGVNIAFVDKLLCLVLICFPKLATISSVLAAVQSSKAGSIAILTCVDHIVNTYQYIHYRGQGYAEDPYQGPGQGLLCSRMLV
ncbi:hypothetical protein Nepgr_006825 [Nepenthes gracilis]|uniref:Uncharacterized protein n=1 Tax=Nepenthes gracilis TaxID=150966 RepID=A0AAD3S647_NEPGR|nr:hypothetical protein Nepgr_006825 [Nepenthes gracilis]